MDSQTKRKYRCEGCDCFVNWLPSGDSECKAADQPVVPELYQNGMTYEGCRWRVWNAKGRPAPVDPSELVIMAQIARASEEDVIEPGFPGVGGLILG